jgi:hypothetical protein
VQDFEFVDKVLEWKNVEWHGVKLLIGGFLRLKKLYTKSLSFEACLHRGRNSSACKRVSVERSR